MAQSYKELAVGVPWFRWTWEKYGEKAMVKWDMGLVEKSERQVVDNGKLGGWQTMGRTSRGGE